jgi:glyoxylase-like metal-dependent hydrolase (beta-lactamase superfamily II)
LTQLGPNLWVAQSRLFFTNSGIFLSRGEACLIDPGVFPGEIHAIAGFVAGQDSEPLKLVLTHIHWDHILGPERFPGVPTVAQAQYLTEVSSQGGAHTRQQIKRWEAKHDIGRTQPLVIPRPAETFEEATTLTVGELTLHLMHAPGHSSDQLVVYQPDSATLWAADMLSDLEIPFISHSLAAYERTLAMLSALDVQVLVPGHGRATTDSTEIRSRVSEDTAYLAELRGRVEQSVLEGRTIQETADLCADMRYRCPEENVGPHRLNVESVYVELGGAADPAEVGWGQLLGETG